MASTRTLRLGCWMPCRLSWCCRRRRKLPNTLLHSQQISFFALWRFNMWLKQQATTNKRVARNTWQLSQNSGMYHDYNSVILYFAPWFTKSPQTYEMFSTYMSSFCLATLVNWQWGQRCMTPGCTCVMWRFNSIIVSNCAEQSFSWHVNLKILYQVYINVSDWPWGRKGTSAVCFNYNYRRLQLAFSN